MTEAIGALIAGAVGGMAEVFFAYPADWAKVPCVAYREAGNRTHARADGKEALKEVEYAIDVWSLSAEEMRSIADAVDEALAGAGFRRAQAMDLFEEKTRYFRRAARYRALSDGDRLYQ
ncbi:MAG: DUF3168 domain-containing protein [Clostridiales bacterium]|jgi:hypothetical protein|nr:DUF3168 domain-containing protein [Clostridiales bacterium]OPZ67253.1 MAG: hypothetical protein BWY81_01403 [Firmicutes bacterium ADurb.Bin467]